MGYFLLRDSAPKGICPLNGENIITIGDSLANGFGVSENDSFGILIPQMLGKRAIKLGIDGETTSGLLARIDSALAHKSIAGIIISIGGNDFMRQFDKAQVARNLNIIAQKAKAKSSCVVILAVPDGVLGGLVGGVSSVYGEVGKNHNVLIEKNAMPKILKSSALKADQIHPNAQGHKIIAENIAALMRESR